MFPIFLSNKKCRLEHVVNELMRTCLITEFLWIFSYKLHGILSNSMDTLSHSMELHRYFREPRGIPWNSMIFHGISWGSLKYRWSSMECHSVSMEFDSIPCGLYEKIHGNSVIKQLIKLLTTCSSLHFLLDRKIGNIWKLKMERTHLRVH